MTDICIYIHCGADIHMTHDILNDFQIRFILTKSGTEGMTKIVCGKIRK